MPGDPSPTNGGYMLRMVGDPFPSNGGVDFFQKSLGDPFPSNGGVDFFQKSLGDPWTIVWLACPTSGGNMLRMAGDPRHDHLIFW